MHSRRFSNARAIASRMRAGLHFVSSVGSPFSKIRLQQGWQNVAGRCDGYPDALPAARSPCKDRMRSIFRKTMRASQMTRSATL